MRPSISVVIPVLNEASNIGRLIQELEASTDLEIIVVDGGSQDSTHAVIEGFADVRKIDSVANRGVQLNEGAAVATGEILWFLHADSKIPSDWQTAIKDVLGMPGMVAGSFPIRFSEDHWLLRIFGEFSRLNHPLFTYGDQGYFLKRSVFLEVGGFQNYPILEDVEIQCRLRKLGGWKKTRSKLTTSARRFIACGILGQQLKNCAIVGCFLLGASPFWLKRFYLPEGYLSARDSAQSASLNPTALSEEDSKNGLFTRFPFWVRSCIAAFLVILGNWSFKPRAR